MSQSAEFDYGTEAQGLLLTEVVDALLRDVFQGRKDHLREHMLGVAAKVSRKHVWPFFDLIVEREVAHRMAGGEPRSYLGAVVNPLEEQT